MNDRCACVEADAPWPGCRICHGSGLVGMSSSDVPIALPLWLVMCYRKLQRLCPIESLDDYDQVQTARHVLASVEIDAIMAPSIRKTAMGEILIEWQNGCRAVAVSIFGRNHGHVTGVAGLPETEDLVQILRHKLRLVFPGNYPVYALEDSVLGSRWG